MGYVSDAWMDSKNVMEDALTLIATINEDRHKDHLHPSRWRAVWVTHEVRVRARKAAALREKEEKARKVREAAEAKAQKARDKEAAKADKQKKREEAKERKKKERERGRRGARRKSSNASAERKRGRKKSCKSKHSRKS